MGSVGILGRLEPKKKRVRQGGKVRTKWQDSLFVNPDEVIKTKDRTYLLEPRLTEPTGRKIIQAWKDNPPKEEQ